MKKLIFTAIALFAFAITANAQVFKIGIKAGPNFANLTGGEIQTKSRTSFHVGGAAEVGLTKKFSIAPELLYSSQGADVDGPGDFNLDYVAVPVLARIYLVEDKFSIDLGPQFSFLVKDADQALNDEKFDFAVAGGLTLNVTKSLFAQARYVAGLTEASKDAEVKNSVVQFSVGYNFL
ncbi:MAG: PorT family protein [Flavobacterium sp.]|nr:MAG: PorT family protein [Flavobacterium sp.]